jgi:hypothetical protein
MDFFYLCHFTQGGQGKYKRQYDIAILQTFLPKNFANVDEPLSTERLPQIQGSPALSPEGLA